MIGLQQRQIELIQRVIHACSIDTGCLFVIERADGRLRRGDCLVVDSARGVPSSITVLSLPLQASASINTKGMPRALLMCGSSGRGVPYV